MTNGETKPKLFGISVDNKENYLYISVKEQDVVDMLDRLLSKDFMGDCHLRVEEIKSPKSGYFVPDLTVLLRQ